jgi:hypothetical protein
MVYLHFAFYIYAPPPPFFSHKVTPKKGKALLWPSVLSEDLFKKDGRTMHQVSSPRSPFSDYLLLSHHINFHWYATPYGIFYPP